MNLELKLGISFSPHQQTVLSKGETRKDACMKTELLKDITNNKEEGEHLPRWRARAQPGSWGWLVASWERVEG